jgi:hypothetical protein
MSIFEESARCDRLHEVSNSCKERLREVHRISQADLIQIEAEGRERLWPPLEPERVSLNPLMEAGMKLCSASPP